jgi:hypothetical protein
MSPSRSAVYRSPGDLQGSWEVPGRSGVSEWALSPSLVDPAGGWLSVNSASNPLSTIYLASHAALFDLPDLPENLPSWEIQERQRETASGRSDPFAILVAEVAADAANAYNIERYLWVLEEPAPRACAWCGELFDPGLDYRGDISRGLPRRYCSRRCAERASASRRRGRLALRWGSAA